MYVKFFEFHWKVRNHQNIEESVYIDSTYLWMNSLAEQNVNDENIELSDLEPYNIDYTVDEPSFWIFGSNLSYKNIFLSL